MKKTLSLVSQKNYNLGANEVFVIFFTSKLITCFIDGFTFENEIPIIYLLNGSEHIYRILDLEDEVHSIWVIWTSKPSRMQGKLKLGGAGKEHGLHPGSEGGVPRTGPKPR